jgi:hypothetical protein
MRVSNVIKKIVGFGFTSAALSAALLAGPSFNFSQIASADATPVIIACSDGSTPSCVTATDSSGHTGVFCSCG